MDYWVSKDKGCLAADGTYYSPGAQIDSTKFRRGQVETLVAAGYLVADEPQPDAEPEGRTGDVSPTPWTFDPAALEGKSVDELNVMVLEIDDSITPFETWLEASEWLSMDYEAA